MRIQLQQAYCLHSRRYRETSRIIDLLTPEHGLISCLGHGSKKKNSSNDLLFTPLLISWSGRGELFTLTHLETTAGKQIMSPSVSIMGMYMNELILKMIPKSSPSKEVFDLYQNVIHLLKSDDKQENALRFFEIELLEHLGHGLSLDQELDHETAICEDLYYQYDIGLGPKKVAQKDLATSHSAWNIVKGATLIAMRSPLNMESSCLKEAKQFMRGIINWHLNSRPLHSREILQFMQA